MCVCVSLALPGLTLGRARRTKPSNEISLLALLPAAVASAHTEKRHPPIRHKNIHNAREKHAQGKNIDTVIGVRMFCLLKETIRG